MTRTSQLDILLYALYTVSSVAGLVIIKTALPHHQAARSVGEWAWASLAQLGVGGALYVGSFGIWLLILGRSELSTAYPVAIGLTLCFSTAAASAVLHEPVGWSKLVGLGLVVLGIVLIFRDRS